MRDSANVKIVIVINNALFLRFAFVKFNIVTVSIKLELFSFFFFIANFIFLSVLKTAKVIRKVIDLLANKANRSCDVNFWLDFFTFIF